MDAQAVGAVPRRSDARPTGAPAAPQRRGPAATPDVRHAVAIVEADPRLRMLLAARLPAAQQFESIDGAHAGARNRAGRRSVVFGPSLVDAVRVRARAPTDVGVPRARRRSSLRTRCRPRSCSTRCGSARATRCRSTSAATRCCQAVARVGELIQTPTRRGARWRRRRRARATGPACRATRRAASSWCSRPRAASASRRSRPTSRRRWRARIDDTVSLMDADLQFGDVSVMLGIPPDHTVVDAAAAIHYADPELMRNLVTRHDTGLMVLPAPSEPTHGRPGSRPTR